MLFEQIGYGRISKQKFSFICPIMNDLNCEQFLAVFPFFRKRRSGLVEEILHKGIHRSLPKSTMLYFDGDECTHIGLILKGVIRVYKTGSSGREITLYEIGPGDTCILNASCILSRMPYPAEAKTSSDCQLLLLSAEHFRMLMNGYEEMRAYLFSLLSQRLVTVISLMEEVAFGKMDARLIDYLIEKAEKDEPF